ncbi:MAG: porin family protein [Pseudomonas sp.]
MNKPVILLILSTLGLTAAPAALAQDANGSGWFVGGYAGRASIDKDDYNGSDTGYGIAGGYRWGLFEWLSLGVEVGYNDLGNIKASNLFNGDEVVQDTSKLRGWTVGINQRFNFSPRWYASLHGGLYGWKGHGLSNDDVFESRSDLDRVSWYAGAGVGYNVTDRFSIGANYDHFDAKKFDVDLSTNLASISAEYRF